MLERTILDYNGLEVKLTDHADKGILDILEHTVRGSEGGLRFSSGNIGERIKGYGNKVRFLSLYRKNKITGTAGACFRVSGLGKLKYPSTYVKYLAFLSIYQTEVSKRKRNMPIIRHDEHDSFKQKTLELFSKPHVLDLPDVKEEDKHILYAFIESNNERSKNIVHQAGFEYIRSFLTLAFSRLSPKKDEKVEILPESDRDTMKHLLREQYKGYSFYTDSYVFIEHNYYVLKENNEIIAGVWAMPTTYKIYDIPGVWGWVIRKFLPIFPYFRRLFPSNELKCLVFDAVFCKKGKEEKLSTLFESVLAKEGFFTGLMWLDDHGDLYETIRTKVKMGPFDRMLNAKPGLVYGKFVNLTDQEKEMFYDAPAYISGYDFS